MPAKQVRFLSTATMNVYSPEPSVYSPASPLMSLPSLTTGTSYSSSGPRTPPSSRPPYLPNPYSVPHAPHPHQYKPFYAPHPASPPQIHYLLASDREMKYDLARHPSTAVAHNRLPLSGHLLSEPATFPAMHHLEITCRHLPRSIVIRASSTVVSVSDVLDGLNAALRRNVGEQEYHSLSPSSQRRVREAYKKRYSSAPDRRAYEAEKRGGVKTVDLLMERSHFAGLKTTHSSKVWMLEIT